MAGPDIDASTHEDLDLRCCFVYSPLASRHRQHPRLEGQDPVRIIAGRAGGLNFIILSMRCVPGLSEYVTIRHGRWDLNTCGEKVDGVLEILDQLMIHRYTVGCARH